MQGRALCPGSTPGDSHRGETLKNAIIPVILLSWQENVLEYIYRDSSARSQIFIIGKSIQCLGAFSYAEREVSLNDKKTEKICRRVSD